MFDFLFASLCYITLPLTNLLYMSTLSYILLCLLCFQWEPVEYFDNKIICDLIEARPMGIIAIMVSIMDFLSISIFFLMH